MTVLQKNSIKFSGKILKPLLYQVLNQYLIKVNSVIPKASGNETNWKNWSKHLKRLIQNLRPISLLNVALKITSKALANCMKMCLPFLILSNQTAYVKERLISESGRLFSDISQVTEFSKLRRLIVIVVIQKTSDSVNQIFSITTLKRFGFCETFTRWI